MSSYFWSKGDNNTCGDDFVCVPNATIDFTDGGNCFRCAGKKQTCFNFTYTDADYDLSTCCTGVCSEDGFCLSGRLSLNQINVPDAIALGRRHGLV